MYQRLPPWPWIFWQDLLSSRFLTDQMRDSTSEWDSTGEQENIYNYGLISSIISGPASGVVAGSKIPNYCVMSDTSNVARIIEKMGEGMRIHISGTSKALLDKVGGFRCEYRGLLDLGVG